MALDTKMHLNATPLSAEDALEAHSRLKRNLIGPWEIIHSGSRAEWRRGLIALVAVLGLVALGDVQGPRGSVVDLQEFSLSAQRIYPPLDLMGDQSVNAQHRAWHAVWAPVVHQSRISPMSASRLAEDQRQWMVQAGLLGQGREASALESIFNRSRCAAFQHLSEFLEGAGTSPPAFEKIAELNRIADVASILSMVHFVGHIMDRSEVPSRVAGTSIAAGDRSARISVAFSQIADFTETLADFRDAQLLSMVGSVDAADKIAMATSGEILRDLAQLIRELVLSDDTASNLTSTSERQSEILARARHILGTFESEHPAEDHMSGLMIAGMLVENFAGQEPSDEDLHASLASLPEDALSAMAWHLWSLKNSDVALTPVMLGDLGDRWHEVRSLASRIEETLRTTEVLSDRPLKI